MKRNELELKGTVVTITGELQSRILRAAAAEHATAAQVIVAAARQYLARPLPPKVA